jgi:hypothetical protein
MPDTATGTEPIPPKALFDGSSIAVLTAEIKNLGREFRDWREQVYLPGHERVEKAVGAEADTRLHVAEDVADIASGRWQANEDAHKLILKRLDNLNGFRNKVQGVLAVIGFAAPIAVMIWALFTR